jgi:hypothetical protein
MHFATPEEKKCILLSKVWHHSQRIEHIEEDILNLPTYRMVIQ